MAWSISMLLKVYSKTKDLPVGCHWDGRKVAAATQVHGVEMVRGADTHAPNSASLNTYNEDSHASGWGYVGRGCVCPACPQVSGPYSHLE